MLSGYNPSLTSTNNFEVPIDDSTCAIEQRVLFLSLFLSAPSPMDTTERARCCDSGRSVQTGEYANARDWVLDSGGQSCRSIHQSTSILASRCVSNPRCGASRPGAARCGGRVVWQSVVDDHRGRELEVGPRKSGCQNWSASDPCRRKVHSAVDGGGLYARNDSARARPLWPGGLVRSGRRNMPGDLRWPHADRSSRGTWGSRSHGIIDASHRHRHRAASFDRPDPPSVFAATDHDGS